MDRKGVELAFNVIIVAVLALIVLIVVVMIFTGGMRDWWEDFRSINTCESNGGQCKESCTENDQAYKDFKNCGKDEFESLSYCCISG